MSALHRKALRLAVRIRTESSDEIRMQLLGFVNTGKNKMAGSVVVGGPYEHRLTKERWWASIGKAAVRGRPVRVGSVTRSFFSMKTLQQLIRRGK